MILTSSFHDLEGMWPKNWYINYEKICDMRLILFHEVTDGS